MNYINNSEAHKYMQRTTDKTKTCISISSARYWMKSNFFLRTA